MDRLSALLSRFHIAVSVTGPGAGNLLIVGDAPTRDPVRIELTTSPTRFDISDREVVLVELQAVWGGPANPLLGALNERISLAVRDDDETGALVRLILAEVRANRCGVDAVLSRLGEVIFVRLVRAEINRGAAERGLLAGLADNRINKALVAIHESPGRQWRNEALAEVAGLSLSRFADVFQARLGQTPQSYLRQWRMTLARQDIVRGDRIKAVSRRYGYASSEALARAFHREFGTAPMAARRAERLA